ncbi:DUF3300 domain-containing protein [Diaphorobacter caeni]|uniref:DUF3300 domain-containing protein n=1 Tax=Diaphorobacter caeni TaxID=2784387 RepID=UPI00188F94AE|nr:DUF3300 domain-containing protein [Diaphorobacter caeni]MBF5006258.1 DUF3300 domain-containing protein [Diaphorobacter caeni]
MQSALSKPPAHHCGPTRDPWGRKVPLSVLGMALALALILTGCNDDVQAPPAAAPASTPVAVDSMPAQPASSATQTVTEATPITYRLPAADVLYQMVAPIALYPDKLVAQVLAGATYPEQISAAEAWLAENPQLIRNDARNSAASEKPWDPSVKGLTEFPNVLAQLASNLPWTTALGKAYYHRPTDVLNAIQVMRERANKAGTLQNSAQLKVTTSPQPTPVANYTPSADMEVNDYPEPVIPQSGEYIEIAESQPDLVFVPRYDPALVYGEPMPVYSGYHHSAPTPAADGLIGFGSGVVLVQTVEHRAWGWHHWNMHWGQRDTSARGWHPGEPPPPPAARPAVVFNNTTYVSRSSSVMDPNRSATEAAAMSITQDQTQSPPGASAPPPPTRHEVKEGARTSHSHGSDHQRRPPPQASGHRNHDSERERSR